jgi:glycosyltransferase involved in cell wall biosynthesis
MKVLVAGSLASSLINFRGELLKCLVDSGLQVDVVAPDIGSDVATKAQLDRLGVAWHTVPLQRTGVNPIADIRTLIAYAKLMRRIKPDVFLGYTAKPIIFGIPAARLCGVSRRIALVTGLGYGFQGGRSRAFLRQMIRGLYTLSLRVASTIVFQNPDDQKTFLDLGLISRSAETALVNGSGVSLDRFTPSPLPAATDSFLMVARLLRDKGVREYVEAAKLVREDYPSAKFVLIGPRDSNPDAIEATELDDWVSSGVIDYRGELQDVRPALAECAVFVLPSYREGTPRSVLEALATGRAVITTDAPGCRETVDHEINGLLVPVASAAAVAEAMRRLIREPALVTRMSQASLQKARSKYDVKLVNEKMRSIILRL